jgi:hypothetical protein
MADPYDDRAVRIIRACVEIARGHAGEFICDTDPSRCRCGETIADAIEERMANNLLPTPVAAETEIPFCPVHKELSDSGKLKPFGNCVACIRNQRDELLKALTILWPKTVEPVYLDSMKYTASGKKGALVCAWCYREGDCEVAHADDCPVTLVRNVLSGGTEGR